MNVIGLLFIPSPPAAFTHGKKFVIGFMSNISPNMEVEFLAIFLTTASNVSVSVTISSSLGKLDVVVPTDDFTKIGDIPQSLEVTASDYSNRHKGLLIEVTGEGTISVLVQNYIEGSAGEYLAYPCMEAKLDNYTYYAVSTKSLEPGARGEILLVACHNNTNITITPTQFVVLPVDAQDPDSDDITVAPGSSHTLVLHSLQTLLIAVANNMLDLTGTKIVSSNPLTVISGHECGNVPTDLDHCEHLSVQIPPTVTWEKSFLLPPFAIRRNGQIYKVTPSHDDTDITYTCESSTTTATIPTAGMPYEFAVEFYMYCSLESNKPVFVTRWSLGAHDDHEGDPTVSPVAAISQYINKVSFVVLDHYDWLYTYVSVTIPIEHFNETYIIIGDEYFDCPWHPIHNSTNGIIAYGCNSRTPEGKFNMKHKKPDGLFSAIFDGFQPCDICSGYAYIAGMKLDSTGN